MPDNAKVAAAATEKNMLPLGEMALIGTFGTDAEPRALVRHASGRVEAVEPGGRVGGRQVLAIEAGQLVLKSGAGSTRLKMPAG